MPKPQPNCSPLTKAVSVYIPIHEYDRFQKRARELNEPLSTHVLSLARRARDDDTPYYVQVGAIHSVMATMLMVLQTREQYGDDRARCDEILNKVDMLVTDLVAPMPRLPNRLHDTLRYRPTGFVKDIAEALAKHLKPERPRPRED